MNCYKLTMAWNQSTWLGSQFINCLSGCGYVVLSWEYLLRRTRQGSKAVQVIHNMGSYARDSTECHGNNIVAQALCTLVSTTTKGSSYVVLSMSAHCCSHAMSAICSLNLAQKELCPNVCLNQSVNQSIYSTVLLQCWRSMEIPTFVQKRSSNIIAVLDHAT